MNDISFAIRKVNNGYTVRATGSKSTPKFEIISEEFICATLDEAKARILEMVDKHLPA